MELNEPQTRSLLINPQPVAADWKLDDCPLVSFEIPVDGRDAGLWNGASTARADRCGQSQLVP
jgi:hypothetical protein